MFRIDKNIPFPHGSGKRKTKELDELKETLLFLKHEESTFIPSHIIHINTIRQYLKEFRLVDRIFIKQQQITPVIGTRIWSKYKIQN